MPPLPGARRGRYGRSPAPAIGSSPGLVSPPSPGPPHTPRTGRGRYGRSPALPLSDARRGRYGRRFHRPPRRSSRLVSPRTGPPVCRATGRPVRRPRPASTAGDGKAAHRPPHGLPRPAHRPGPPSTEPVRAAPGRPVPLRRAPERRSPAATTIPGSRPSPRPPRPWPPEFLGRNHVPPDPSTPTGRLSRHVFLRHYRPALLRTPTVSAVGSLLGAEFCPRPSDPPDGAYPDPNRARAHSSEGRLRYGSDPHSRCPAASYSPTRSPAQYHRR